MEQENKNQMNGNSGQAPQQDGLYHYSYMNNRGDSRFDRPSTKAAKDKLMESAQNLFSKLYEQNGPGANAGTGAGTPDYSDGDVVDGDFTEV